MTLISCKITVSTVLSGCVLCLARGQGTFDNLNFEQANVPFVPANQFGADVASTDGVPGWTAFIDGNQVVTILHNNVTLGSAEVALFGPQWYSNRIYEGSYSVLVGGSTAGPSTSAAIGQTGQIPQSAKSLVFFVSNPYVLRTTFAGQLIPLVQIGSTANYIIVGGDISSFTGQTGQLLLTAPPGGGAIIDNFQFSDLAIPEPSTFCMFGLGALLLGWRFLCKRT